MAQLTGETPRENPFLFVRAASYQGLKRKLPRLALPLIQWKAL